MTQMTAISDIEQCSDVGALCTLLSEKTAAICRNVCEIAAIIRRLDELGAEVAIEDAMLPYYRLIACGSLSANAFTKLCGEPSLLECVRQLPVPIQEKLAAGEPVKVMEIGGDFRMVRPLDLTKRERQQVFRGKRLRTDAEQIGWLREKLESQNIKAAVSHAEVTVDRRRKGIVYEGRFFSLAELAGYVARLSQ